MRADDSFGLQDAVVTRTRLSDFRSGQHDCVVALWIDIDARIVLASDSGLLYPQEKLDMLCANASSALAFPSMGNSAAPNHVIFTGPTSSRVLLRDLAMPAHALVCICSPDADPADLLDAMGSFLASVRQMEASG